MPFTRSSLGSPRRIAAFTAAAVIAVLVIVGQLTDPEAVSLTTSGIGAVIGVAFTVMGTLLLTGAPGHPVGRLMTAAGVISALGVMAASWSGWLPLAWLSQWLWWPPLGLIFLSLLFFPDGRLPSRRWLPVAVFITALIGLGAVGLALAALEYPRTLLTTTNRVVTGWALVAYQIGRWSALLSLLGLVMVLVSLWSRWRRADGDTRQQLACLLLAGVLLLLTLSLDALGLSGAWLIAAVTVPIAMTVAVLRYRLYELDQIINRTLVWVTMTLLVIVGFVAIVALLRDLLFDSDASNSSLVATGLIAVAFEPVRSQVQRGVNHLLYGDSDDPYRVISRLGDLLRQTVEPQAVLPLLTSTIAHSLQVPYVAVEIYESEGPRRFAEYGKSEPPTVDSFDMVAHGELIGRLLVAPRTVGGKFTPRERRLLSSVALHAAVAAEATQLFRDLQTSRERLIMAREEERRRLRRDLHDGVGPTLTGMSMQVHAARKSAHDPERVRQILDGIAKDLRLCTQEVRQLVDQLRPPELDGGLEAALRSACRRFNKQELTVELKVSDALTGLPAAIEVAAYRIVSEALNNTARHAQARTCVITIERARSLSIEVVDDGIGINPDSSGRSGVGLQSMRERALELGGNCLITSVEPHGTKVKVELPLPRTTEPQS